MDEGVGSNNPLAHAHEAPPDLLIKHVVPVIDGDPAEPPARNKEPLGQTGAGEDRDCGGQGRDGNIGLAREHKVLVDLIRNDRDLVLLRDGQNVLHVLDAEHRATGVAGRVDDDGGSVLIDHRLHMVEVGLPVLVGQEVVLPGLDLLAGGERHVEREAGPGHQDVLPGVRQGGDGDVEGAGAARAEDHVICGDLGAGDAHIVSHGLARVHKPGAGAVTVPEAANQRVPDRLHHLGGRVEVLVDGRIAESQRDHLLVWVRGEHHRLHDVSDRVEGVLGHNRCIDLPLRPDHVLVVIPIAIDVLWRKTQISNDRVLHT